MRGKDDEGTATKDKVGITPAYAGKSIELEEKKDEAKDHPRLCGEKPYFYDAVTQRVGSPPPMRGKADVFVA